MKSLKSLAALFLLWSISSAQADSPLGGYTSEVAGLYNRQADKTGLKTHLHLEKCKNDTVVLCNYVGDRGVSISAFSVADKNDLNFLLLSFHGQQDDTLNLIITIINLIKTYDTNADDHEIAGVLDKVGDAMQVHNVTKNIAYHNLAITVSNNDSFGVLIGFAQT